MKIPYQIILVPFLLKINAQEQKPIQLSPIVSDFSVLATEWAKEYLEKDQGHPEGLDWIDFDASRQETRNFCEQQDIKYRLKDCKMDIKQKDFSIDKINQVTKGEQVLFSQTHINNSSESDRGTINREFSYKDINRIITTKGFRESLSKGFNIHVGGKVYLGNWGIDTNFKFNTDWSASNTNEQRHEESKKLAIKEEFNFPPYSKTEVSFLLQEANYDIAFSNDINIGGFFVFKCNGGTLWIFGPEDIVRHIEDYPWNYSGYIKELAKPYTRTGKRERNHYYWELKYNATGKMQGIYGYKVDSKKKSTSLNKATPTQTQTATVVPTNQANYLAVNKYSSASLAFLAGILLK